jgi:hypothetical protein
MDLVSNSNRSLQHMPISKSCLWHGSTAPRWPLSLTSHSGFHQWLCGKYRWRSKRVRGFPVLVFFRSGQFVVPRGPQNPIMYSMHVTLVTPVLHSQLVPRDSSQGQTWLQVAKMQRAAAFPAPLQLALPIRKPSMHTQPGRPAAAPDFLQSLPVTSQAVSQTLSHLYKAQHRTAFPALLPAASSTTQLAARTQPGQPEPDARFIPQGRRPVELSYVLPTASTVARPEQRQEAPGVFASPVGHQSLPTPSQAPGIDVNRLTEHVYQALERKIRLERQRRGYR